MNDKVRWGVLGVADIAVKKVIPAMQRGAWSTVTAIASRDPEKARRAADALGIPKAYGSYEELLADPDVEAVYNPLPNHLHVPWTTKAAEAGKHVLCEKPLGLTAEDAAALVDVRDRTGVRIEEAFMIVTHPQWLAALDVVRSGRIGPVRAVMCYFGYFNADPRNIRNVPEYGGGGLMDVGCYAILAARLAFGAEPTRVIGHVERDPATGTDVLTSALLDFPSGQSAFTCSTRAVPYQRVQILGERGRVEIEIPFNAPPDRPCRIFVDDGSSVTGEGVETVELEVCDQYTLQGDAFSRAVRENAEPPLPLESSVANMAVIDAILRSARSGAWESPLTPPPSGPRAGS
jgi:predicted dehydrogenase